VTERYANATLKFFPKIQVSEHTSFSKLTAHKQCKITDFCVTNGDENLSNIKIVLSARNVCQRGYS